MTTRPDKAFILAAGYGKRLRPYTDHCPKPLVPLAGQPIIGHVLDRLREAGVRQVTVNLHYMGDMLADYLRQRKDMEIVLSFETELMETGGGVKQALPTQGDEPFYVVSGDSTWDNGASGIALHRLADKWKGSHMDLLLMMQPLDRMELTPGVGDYDVRKDGRAVRSLEKTGVYMWSSVRVCSARLFDNTPDGPFSFLMLMDRAQGSDRLYGHVHDGEWYHITTPEDLDRVNEALAHSSSPSPLRGEGRGEGVCVS
jgi:MurNAc alpha-1-phosphate uridylyltransferase